VVPGVRDGYLIRDPRPAGPATEAAVARLPARLAAAAHLLASHGAPSPRDLPGVTEIPTGRALGLTPVEPPRPAPGVDAPDARGLRHRLGDYAGKVVLVNFWASWCPPCVDEIPSMNRLASGYEPADFEILSLNFRESPERILAFLRRVEVDFPVLLDPEGRIAERWKVLRFPSFPARPPGPHPLLGEQRHRVGRGGAPPVGGRARERARAHRWARAPGLAHR